MKSIKKITAGLTLACLVLSIGVQPLSASNNYKGLDSVGNEFDRSGKGDYTNPSSQTIVNNMLDPARTWDDNKDKHNTITVTTHVVDINDLYSYVQNQNSTCDDQTFKGDLIVAHDPTCSVWDDKQKLLRLIGELNAHGHHSASYSSSTKRKTYSNLSNITAGYIDWLVDNSGLKIEVLPQDGEGVRDADGNYLSEHFTNSPLILKKDKMTGGIIGIERAFGGDAPGYIMIRMFVESNTLIIQQADIIPYEELWGANGLEPGSAAHRRFDASLIRAGNLGWKFRTDEFKTRFGGIMSEFGAQLEYVRNNR